MWLEVRGLGLLTGQSGSGKSITVRNFVSTLSPDQYTVHHFQQIPTTPNGFLRALSRRLGLSPRMHLSDMFDAIQATLTAHQEEHGTHVVLLFDDAEGMRVATLDLVRRLTASELDSTNHVSILLTGTEDLMRTLQAPTLTPLRSRFTYAHTLRPFGLEDTRNYLRFHLDSANGEPSLFTDGAVKLLFNQSQGVPRKINQLALQALVDAVVLGSDGVDDRSMARTIHAHPLYGTSPSR